MRSANEKRKRAVWQKEHRKKLFNEGMCIDACGRAAFEDRGELRSRCETCLKRMRFWMQERRERAKRNARRIPMRLSA